MLAKLRLDQTKTYEQCVAAFMASEMVVAFVESREHIISIGAEQGNLKEWDDFIIEKNNDILVHLQIKRQQTDFSDRQPFRDPADAVLSNLDKAMYNLADWTKNFMATDTVKRKFVIELPEGKIKIKAGIEIRQFRDFITYHIGETTTVQKLENLHTIIKDTNTINIFDWLTTWCGFDNWEQILKTLSILKIAMVGTENDLDTRSTDMLARAFSEPEKVLKEIKSYCRDNSTYTGSIAPRQLLHQLKDNILSSIRTWTQFENDGLTFKISGIHDLESNSEIERPSKIVPALWNNDRQKNLILNINSSGIDFNKPIGELFQLALHFRGNNAALCLNWLAWHHAIQNQIGGTLGVAKDDCNCDNLNISENATPSEVFDAQFFDTLAKQDAFATSLSEEMTKETWLQVNLKLGELIRTMSTNNSPELRDAIELRWNFWKASIVNDIKLQKEFFRKILHPAAEGNRIQSELRVGPKTQTIIAEGLHLLLIISVALSDKAQDWTVVENELSINTIGLGFWSGPETEKSRVRVIDEDNSVINLIGKESSDVLLIAQSRLPESYLYSKLLQTGTKPSNSLASPNRPKLLITRNSILDNHINHGLIAPFRKYLFQIIQNNRTSITESINEVAL